MADRIQLDIHEAIKSVIDDANASWWKHGAVIMALDHFMETIDDGGVERLTESEYLRYKNELRAAKTRAELRLIMASSVADGLKLPAGILDAGTVVSFLYVHTASPRDVSYFPVIIVGLLGAIITALSVYAMFSHRAWVLILAKHATAFEKYEDAWETFKSKPNTAKSTGELREGEFFATTYRKGKPFNEAVARNGKWVYFKDSPAELAKYRDSLSVEDRAFYDSQAAEEPATDAEK